MPGQPETGKEYIQPNEEQDIDIIIDTIIQYLKKTYPSGNTLRQFHAKMHGFVEAVFKVDDNLPPNIQHGFLQAGKSYKTWIRFSNGNAKIVDDRKGDLRGMAIKLLDVPGDMLVQDEASPQSQDILLVSYPTLMTADVAGFKANINALCGGLIGVIKFGINPFNWPTLIRTLQSMKKMNNLFNQQYWSVSPSRLGTTDQAIKYSVAPASTPTILQPTKKNPHFLRDVMQEELNQQDFIFHFMIQFQEDAVSMPIENPCVEWKSPWIKVGEMTIPRQVFNTVERDALGENASYSPWHSLAAHQPLGGVSRARKKAYAAIAAYRLQNNQNL
ncbi:MAG TPA: hypothetical protein VIJ27_01285 [Mucilaginibacter sp.]